MQNVAEYGRRIYREKMSVPAYIAARDQPQGQRLPPEGDAGDNAERDPEREPALEYAERLPVVIELKPLASRLQPRRVPALLGAALFVLGLAATCGAQDGAIRGNMFRQVQERWMEWQKLFLSIIPFPEISAARAMPLAIISCAVSSTPTNRPPCSTNWRRWASPAKPRPGR